MKTEWSRDYLDKKYGRNGARRFMILQMSYAEGQTGHNWIFKRTPDKYILERGCDCGCCHAEDHGACDEFTGGANGRCVYCDHGKDCHPGTGYMHNAPLGPVVRDIHRQAAENEEMEGINDLYDEYELED